MLNAVSLQTKTYNTSRVIASKKVGTKITLGDRSFRACLRGERVTLVLGLL